MARIVSAVGVHCIGPDRDGYGEFLQRINSAGRRLSVVKCRDDFGAVDEPLELWPETLCIGAKTDWDGGPFDAQDAIRKITAAQAAKPAIHYWEYLNEINGIYDQQADFYIALMPLMKAAGLGLVIFNSASGTPSYPSEDGGAAYQEVARACKFAKDNHYDVLLGLHEYISDGETIGRYKVLADYLAAHDALIPIVITEWLFETHPGDAEFMQAVRDNDPIYLGDPRVLGLATWTLGGGGWSGSNYETALPQLAEYIATVGEHQTVPFVFGIHCTSSPGPMLAGDLAGITAAGKFNGYKFLTGDPPEHYAQVAALGLPPANALTRLFVDFSNRPKPTPAQFCDEQRLAISEAMSAGVTWFEVHNEPNLTSEWPYSAAPDDFINWLLPVYAQLRAEHPGIKLVSPGLSPQPNTPTWWAEFAEHGVFAQSDAIGAHVYWPSRDVMLTQAQGLNFIPLQQYASADKPIFITEYSNNIGNTTDFDKGAQYIEWAAYIQAHHLLVTRAYLYIISSATDSDNTTRQTIVRGGVVSQIATGIHDTTPAPQTQWIFEHYHLDGSAAITTNPLTITMDREHTLIVNAIQVAAGRFRLTVTIDPPEARIEVILTPPQPAEGYLVGQSVEVFTRSLP